MTAPQQPIELHPMQRQLAAPAVNINESSMTVAFQPQQEAVAGYLPVQDLFEYQVDLWQRSILFWDTLRKRANNMLEHERAGLPPLLDFKYETILDARDFEEPSNYALLRITEIGEDCWDDCVDLENHR